LNNVSAFATWLFATWSHGACRRIWTFHLKVMSCEFYHCATWGKTTQWNCEVSKKYNKAAAFSTWLVVPFSLLPYLQRDMNPRSEDYALRVLPLCCQGTTNRKQVWAQNWMSVPALEIWLFTTIVVSLCMQWDMNQAWSKPEIFQKSVSPQNSLFSLNTYYFPFVDH